PTIMRERFVRVCHSVRIFAFLDRIALVRSSIQKLERETINHRFVTSTARIANYPANRQRSATVLIHLNGNLISSAADSAAAHFDARLYVFNSLLKSLNRIITGTFTNLFKRTVKNLFGNGAFAIPHHAVDELCHQRAVVNRIRKNFSASWAASSWHNLYLSATSSLL